MGKEINGFKSKYADIDLYYYSTFPRLISFFKRKAIVVEQHRILGNNRIFVKGKAVGYENDEWGNLIITNP